MATLDRIQRVESLPRGAGKFSSPDYEEAGGGSAATAAVTIARLGGEARFVGRVGEDAAGTAIREELRAFGVDVRPLAIVTGSRSPIGHVTVDANGERQVTRYRGLRLDVPPEWISAADLAGASGVLVDMDWWFGANQVVQMARAAGIPSVLDAGTNADPRSAGLLQLVDHVVFSQAGLALLSGTDNPQHGLQWARANTRPSCRIGVTLGAQGSVWLVDGAPRHVPALAVKVVDTFGAGDVFHGAYALALAEGLDVVGAAQFATSAAALKCLRPSARKGLPSRAEVDAMLPPRGRGKT